MPSFFFVPFLLGWRHLSFLYFSQTQQTPSFGFAKIRLRVDPGDEQARKPFSRTHSFPAATKRHARKRMGKD